jgi:hypothetical protein
VTIDVDERLEGDVNAEGSVFASDDEAVIFGVLDAEGRGDAHRRSFALRRMAREDAGRSVGETKAGDAEAGDAGEVSSLTLVNLRVFLGAVDEGELFLEGHLAEKLVDARIAGDDGD